MCRILLTLLTVVGMSAAASAQQQHSMNSTPSKSGILVAYFSATGTTARAAERVAAATGGDLYAITLREPYTAADLDWHDRGSRSSVEMGDPDPCSALQGTKRDIADYDVVFIGYPIWWNLAPRIVNTFIEEHALKGKTVIPFATSGSSSIANSAAVLQREYPGLN